MQQEDSDVLHRSTLWRRRTGRIKNTGRGRRSREQDDLTIGLVAGIVDLIRESGTCFTWELSIFARRKFKYADGDFVCLDDFPEDQKTRLLCGFQQTINEIGGILKRFDSAGAPLPVGLLLYAAAKYAEDNAGLSPVDEVTIKKLYVKGGKLASASEALSAREQFRFMREEEKLKHQKDRSIDGKEENLSVARGNQKHNGKIFLRGNERPAQLSEPNKRSHSYLHRINELRACGLSKQMCFKWKNDKRLPLACRLVEEIFKDSPAWVEKESPLFHNPILTDLLNKSL
jgi:hypothetical protein